MLVLCPTSLDALKDGSDSAKQEQTVTTAHAVDTRRITFTVLSSIGSTEKNTRTPAGKAACLERIETVEETVVPFATLPWVCALGFHLCFN